MFLNSARLIVSPAIASHNVTKVLGIRFLIRDKNSTARPPPFTRPLSAGHSYEIYENPGAKPLVFLAKRFQQITDATKQRVREKLLRGEMEHAFARRILEQFPVGEMTRSDWDPEETALTEHFPPPEWTSQDSLPMGSLTVLRPRAGLFVVRSESPAPRVLVIMEPFYPGWTASIDGIHAPLIPVNAAGKAVPLPAGTHTIRVSYSPRIFFWGGLVSIVTLFLWLIAFRRFKSPLHDDRAPDLPLLFLAFRLIRSR
jgi:hypothetical protein